MGLSNKVFSPYLFFALMQNKEQQDEQTRLENWHRMNNRRVSVVVDEKCESYEGTCRHNCIIFSLVDGLPRREERVIDAITIAGNAYWEFLEPVEIRCHFYYLRNKLEPVQAFYKFLFESHK